MDTKSQQQQQKRRSIKCVHANIIAINAIGNECWPTVDIYLKRINHFNFISHVVVQKKSCANVYLENDYERCAGEWESLQKRRKKNAATSRSGIFP